MAFPRAKRSTPPVLATIGYEGATPPAVIDALRAAGVTLLVDVRAAARSRRPGFAKSRLAGGLADAGIAYRHAAALGTPADGRAAARAGRHAAMRAIFAEHLATAPAEAALAEVGALARAERACLLCFEADPGHCHRLLVADALAAREAGLTVVHLHPEPAPAD